MKLAEKYEAIQSARQAAAEVIVAEYLGAMPAVIYEVGGPASDYKPTEWSVVGARAPYLPAANFAKKPTRANVEALENEPPITSDGVQLLVTTTAAYGTITKSVALIDSGKKFWLAPEPAAERGAELREIYTLKPGQFRCAYCGKGSDQTQKVRRRIISRQYPGFGKEFDHCSAECATYNQYAHEG